MSQEMAGFWDGMAVASAGQYANNLHVAPDLQITTPTTRHSIFAGRMLFLTPNQQQARRQGGALGAYAPPK